MPLIHLETKINSHIQVCFDLSRSIDLHKISMSNSRENAVAGTTTGLIGLNEFVTWEAIHFGIKQQLTSQITAFDYPNHFRDEQQKGPFKSIVHDHYFEQQGELVIMKDDFNFNSPFGLLGKIANIILRPYLTRLLTERNRVIKNCAESGEWKKIIHSIIHPQQK
jgi:ligand-binding SRPBCC domain-containing protein